MGVAANLTSHAVGELVGRDALGQPIYVVVVKASFSFATPGVLTPVSPSPIADVDRYMANPASSGVVAAADLGLPKPRVDVLLQGALEFPRPLAEGVVVLQIGRRLDKRAKVFGERSWLPGVAAKLVPSKARPVTSLAIAWELAAGGTDAHDPTSTDRRNPVGRPTGGAAHELQGKPLPSFQAFAERDDGWKSRRAPCGFGPLAPHWEPRAPLAGTFDDRWRQTRAPLLPEDFRAEFLNCAPLDQQLSSYVAGEEVRLLGMTAAGSATFALPAFEVPVTFVMPELIRETRTRVDTIVIEPAAARVSLVARAFCSPRPTATAVRQIFVGPLTRGRRRALELGKPFLDLRATPPRLGA